MFTVREQEAIYLRWIRSYGHRAHVDDYASLISRAGLDGESPHIAFGRSMHECSARHSALAAHALYSKVIAQSDCNQLRRISTGPYGTSLSVGDVHLMAGAIVTQSLSNIEPLCFDGVAFEGNQSLDAIRSLCSLIRGSGRHRLARLRSHDVDPTIDMLTSL
jgi:hypothetical protein